VKDRCEDEISLKRTAHQAAGRPKREAAPPPPRIPRITRLMALAIKFQDMIDRGEVKDYADLARLGYVTRARVTQIMNLLLLAPSIQERIIDCRNAPYAAEPEIRRIVRDVHWGDQNRAQLDLLSTGTSQAPPRSAPAAKPAAHRAR